MKTAVATIILILGSIIIGLIAFSVYKSSNYSSHYPSQYATTTDNQYGTTIGTNGGQNDGDGQYGPGTDVCTADAMQCGDGSYVGRSGPKCEFVCNKKLL